MCKILMGLKKIFLFNNTWAIQLMLAILLLLCYLIYVKPIYIDIYLSLMEL